MTGKVIHGGTTIACPHGGVASPVASGHRSVQVEGAETGTATLVHTVVGCRHVVDAVPHPCTTVRWTPDTDGVLVDGAPVLLDTTPAQCFSAGLVPQGPPFVSAAAEGVFCR